MAFGLEKRRNKGKLAQLAPDLRQGVRLSRKSLQVIRRTFIGTGESKLNDEIILIRRAFRVPAGQDMILPVKAQAQEIAGPDETPPGFGKAWQFQSEFVRKPQVAREPSGGWTTPEAISCHNSTPCP